MAYFEQLHAIIRNLYIYILRKVCRSGATVRVESESAFGTAVIIQSPLPGSSLGQ